jgi:hypothetical protein
MHELMHQACLLSAVINVSASCRAGQTTMEDWATFSTTLLPLVMTAEGMPQCVRDLCAPLHRVATYFVRYQEGQTEPCHLLAASKAALEFADLCERAFRRHELATHQMHVVAVHLAHVAQAWGPTAHLCEYWIERLMQVLDHVKCPECCSCDPYI